MFSVADIATFVMVNAASTLGAPPADNRANLHAWRARTAARPAVRRELDATHAFLQTLFAPPVQRATAS